MSSCRRRAAAGARCGGATTVRHEPVARAWASDDLGDAVVAVELARLLVGPDDVEREVLEHPGPDAVALRRRAVGAAEQAVVDQLGRAGEAVAMELRGRPRSRPTSR